MDASVLEVFGDRPQDNLSAVSDRIAFKFARLALEFGQHYRTLARYLYRVCQKRPQLVLVMGYPHARAGQDIGRADEDRIAVEPCHDLLDLRQGTDLGPARLRDGESIEQRGKLLPILGAINRGGLGAQNVDAARSELEG